MVKTYQLKALWPLLQSLKLEKAPLHATWDVYDDGPVKYAVFHDGIWLFASKDQLNEHEFEGLTGFHPADLVPMKIDGVDGYLYSRLGGVPLLPIPFTKDQLVEFDEQAAGLISSMLERGADTEAWIADLEMSNPEAAELANGILYGWAPTELSVDQVSPDLDEELPHSSNAPAIPFKKAALIDKYHHEWPTIARDIKDAKENGLADAAKAGDRGWWEDRSLAWAEANGKKVAASKNTEQLQEAMRILSNLPSRSHSLKD